VFLIIEWSPSYQQSATLRGCNNHFDHNHHNNYDHNHHYPGTNNQKSRALGHSQRRICLCNYYKIKSTSEWVSFSLFIFHRRPRTTQRQAKIPPSLVLVASQLTTCCSWSFSAREKERQKRPKIQLGASQKRQSSQQALTLLVSTWP
jgi:hypothetical protein